MADEPISEAPKNDVQPEFKKPVLIGRIGKLPKLSVKPKIETDNASVDKNDEKPPEIPAEPCLKSSLPPALLLKELSTPIPYKEPIWSGLCPDGSDYGLEVLKSGCIVERINLTTKPFYVFGRLANCDVIMAHPTISRHHCVLQYKAFAEEGEQSSGWYMYDLGSTHGTFLNKERLKASHYTRVRVGHQIKFGNSTRTYVVLGPDFDCEGESELTVSEIKQRAEEMRAERDRFIQEAKEQREKERIEAEKKREAQGIDWGMGEDAEEEPDLAENPFAITTNEELYLEDPKKTLRGYFEREGHELTYDCEERGHGQYICRVELPMDDARGRPVVAEAIHTGKKKEAVIACALEACRVLDRAGLLRQAKHESRRRKSRDWSADDYYDSDDDTFLDRTGHVERKRKARMQRHGAGDDKDQGPLSYDDLLKRIQELESKISAEQKTLDRLRSTNKKDGQTDGDTDELDAYMDSLKQGGQSMAVKADISRTKMGIQKLKTELAKTRRLADIARPAHLPPLIKKDDHKLAVKINNSVVYGKRIKLKEDAEKRPKPKPAANKQTSDEFVEEVDSDEEILETSRSKEESSKSHTIQKTGTSGSSSEKSEMDNQKAIQKIETAVEKNSEEENLETQSVEESRREKKMYGPMRPPENYVIPEDYFNQESDRDLPEIMEKD